MARTEMPSMLTSRAMFERHLDCIGRHFQFVSLDEIGAHVLSGEPFTQPVAAITFDDGYQDVYENAFPVLERKGIPAAMFVVTDLVGRPFWQIHDKLYHLVAKAFATWDDPRRELCGAAAPTLGLPTAPTHASRAATRTRCSRSRRCCPVCRSRTSVPRDGRPRSQRRQRLLQHAADGRLGRAPRHAPRRLHDRLPHEEPRLAAGGIAGSRRRRARRDRGRRSRRTSASRSRTSRIPAASSRRRSSRRSRAPDTGSPTPPASTAMPRHPR